MKARGEPLPDLPGSRGQRVARCQNTACMSAQRSGLGEEELALLTLSGRGRKVGFSWRTEPTERVANGHRTAGLGRRKRGGTTGQHHRRFYWTVSGKSKGYRNIQHVPIPWALFTLYHTLRFSYVEEELFKILYLREVTNAVHTGMSRNNQTFIIYFIELCTY